MGKILVIGSTGRVGVATMDLLAQRGLPVRAVSRQPGRIPVVEGVERAYFDYLDPSSFDAVLEDVDRIFMMVPPGASAALDALGPFLDHALPVAKKVVLMTIIGIENEPRSALRRLEQLIESSGVPHVLLRPNIFMDNFHTLWRESINRTGVIALPAGDAEIAFVDAREVGACATAALTTDAFDGRAFTLTGPQSLSLDKVAGTFSKVLGKEIRYEDVEDETFRQSLLQGGLPPNYAKTLVALFAVARTGRCAEPNDSIEELLGRPTRTFARYVSINVGAWRPRRE